MHYKIYLLFALLLSVEDFQENIIEGVCPCVRQLGFTFLYPAIVPNPVKVSVLISISAIEVRQF